MYEDSLILRVIIIRDNYEKRGLNVHEKYAISIQPTIWYLREALLQLMTLHVPSPLNSAAHHDCDDMQPEPTSCRQASRL